MSSKKKNKRKRASARSSEPTQTAPPTIDDHMAGLRWEREEQPAASNRDRAFLATFLTVFSVWIIILAWLVWESLG